MGNFFRMREDDCIPEDYFEEFPPYNETDGFSEFADDNYFESIASMTDCTGLIPNGMVNNYEGRSYADLYSNVHQPKGTDPAKTKAPQTPLNNPDSKQPQDYDTAETE